MDKAKYSRPTAIHEAAHAVVMIALGMLPKAIHMRTRDELRAGDLIELSDGSRSSAIGLTEGGGRINIYLRRFNAAHGISPQPLDRAEAEDDMSVLLAGTFAEARHLKKDAVPMFTHRGGQTDMHHVMDLAAALDDSLVGLRAAMRTARKLVKRDWPAIVALADLIQTRRHTNQESIRTLVEAHGVLLGSGRS